MSFLAYAAEGAAKAVLEAPPKWAVAAVAAVVAQEENCGRLILCKLPLQQAE